VGKLSIGSRIKEARKSKKLTQTMLASKVNKSPQVISNWERGYTTPDSIDIAELSKALEVSADYLLRDDKSKLNNKIETHKNENLFFFDLEGLSEEDIEHLKEHIEFLRKKAKQYNDDSKKDD
jgi:HTH-type transcriptional regulator, competence development regulator